MTRTDYYYDPAAPEAHRIVPAASAVVVNDEQKILLQRRRDNGYWSLPGGMMEVGESIAETVIRETREETGIEVVPEYIIGVYSDPRHIIAYSEHDVRQQFSICFACRMVGGALQADEDEATAVGFFAVDELAQLAIHPSIRLRIQHYLERRERPYFS
ncbi:ADP-ribose pyrophosphatase YjhB (NUDIX family) [Thermosporothrix hazakensis]|uniref:ADP-ribose pyrophosphatase YjhB (NUDIX family) n=2 Tax=Thermosporothrix TaxID=768650 RepID=A0A326UET5_THEHA|nr:NUDIX domain-containing protein [Thermosporothrix hazakensis]PZW36435.1 ADP-ribose pyrophosphatase YjhB (NUDIX family) [Thermosporothrix hazakensis]BBH88902.1 putative MutT/NUDIX-like protein [Thermosporothrix sp. COM3]GCE47087.1 putative MutT/NUDIX-like protein [Thermosporothrix hazakensis]